VAGLSSVYESKNRVKIQRNQGTRFEGRKRKGNAK
jgi:hypothetical protein